jgi:rRNA-processing protein EBP2
VAVVQVITLPTTSGDSVPDISDDISREMAFYTAAKAAADEAVRRFEEASISWQRPPDYYAESVKSDAHMAKVKQQLMFEEQAIEQAEQRCDS